MRKINPYLFITLFITLIVLGYFFYIHEVSEPRFVGLKKVGKKSIVNNKPTINNEKYVIVQPQIKISEYEKTSSESEYQYSPDPIVEKSLLSTVYNVCTQYFLAKTFSTAPYVSRLKTDVQREFFNKASLNCEQLNISHPEYPFEASIKERKVQRQIKGTTRFGKLLEYNKEPFSIEDILYVNEVVGKEYPELLSSDLIYKTWLYQIDVINPNLQRVLSTTNINYVTRIIRHTKKYLACELGVNCSYNSNIMFNYCRTEPNFCVNDLYPKKRTQKL